MAGQHFKFEWDDRDAVALFNRIIAGGHRLRPLMLEIGHELVRSSQDRIDQQVDPDGHAWIDLAPSTRARKRGTQILIERGYLRGGINVTEASDEHVEISPDREYAAIHQFGGTPDMAPGPAAIPARPYLGISREDEGMILRAAQAYLEDLVGPG